MAGISRNALIKQMTAEIKRKIFDDVEKNCTKFCNHLCESAINYRMSAPYAHNFTGNLLNSIVACLYREGKLVYVSAADGKIPKAIQKKMTAPYRYFFADDYDHAKSSYFPSIETVGWGWQDAMEFVQLYKTMSDSKNIVFEIVVAYTTEYASFVEQERQTTGILQSYADTSRVGTTWLKLPKA